MKRVLFFVCLFVSAVPLQAATRTWSGPGGGVWSNPGNWEEGIVPTAGDALVFATNQEGSTNDLQNFAYQSITVMNNHDVAGNPVTVTGGIYVGSSARWFTIANVVATTPQTWTCDARWLCAYSSATIDSTVTVASIGKTTFTPRGTGTIHHVGGGLELYLRVPGWTGTVVQEGGALLMTGVEGDAVDYESSLTCPWSGCTDGLSFSSMIELRSLSAEGGYVRTSNHSSPESGAAHVLGRLYLGSGTELDLAHATTRTVFSVGAGAGTDGTVTLGGGTLSLGPSNWGYAELIAPGTVITLIANDGIDPISGTFRGLPEGATLRSRTGQRFRISYVGGSGNDVTLTALAHYSAPVDLDADGRSEILWRHASTGENYRWTMDGALRSAFGTFNVVPDLHWKVAAQADFDADGDTDLLWRHDVSGENYIYLMQDGAIAAAGTVNVVDSAWLVGAAGDVNGDGRADVIWRNQWTNQTYIYLMDGMTIRGGGPLRDISFDWIIGTGDLNLDGRDDIVLSNRSTGKIETWLLDNFTILSEAYVGSLPGYVLVGVGQFNPRTGPLDPRSDHFADLVLRNETTGELDIRLMQFGSFRWRLGIDDGHYFKGIVAPEWKIAAVGDYNGVSVSELLWRHSITGENYLWLFNGGGTDPTYTGHVLPATPDLNWKIVP